jgi:NADH:ubiquinone oxidoreductase subunit F (NADH-binding)
MSTSSYLLTEEQAASPPSPRRRTGLPRLLASLPRGGAMSLAEHLSVHGEPPRPRRRRAHSGLIEEVERAGLRGRGGGGFPTARKMQAVAASRGRPVVLVNAAEGEPASRKDRTLIARVPHLVLDGAELAANSLGAHEALIGVCESAVSGFDALAQAIAEREASGLSSVAVTLHPVSSRYVAGQESALIDLLDGGGGLPRFTPPMPFERGVARRPTLVANVETLAHVALIARHGADWFRELGTPAEPGSMLATIGGPLAHPGVYELETGTPLRALVQAAGGLTHEPRAALIGGYGGVWVGAEHFSQLALSDAGLAPHGGGFGAGVVFVLDAGACPVAEVAALSQWLSAQSAGQCGPCVHGLHAIAERFVQLRDGVGGNGSHAAEIHRLSAVVRGRGACGHPDGASRMLASALEVFATEMDDHARHGPCERCAAPRRLPLGEEIAA